MYISFRAQELAAEYRFLLNQKDTTGARIDQLSEYSSEFSLKCAIADLKRLPDIPDEVRAAEYEEALREDQERRDWRRQVREEKEEKELAIYNSLKKGEAAFYNDHPVKVISKNKSTMKITAIKEENGEKIVAKAKWFHI